MNDFICGDELKFHHNVVDFISERFSRNLCYTWADLVLISLNPFKCDEGNSERNLHFMQQLKESPIGKMEPHIFSVAKRAYYHLITSRRDQIIMISGDSGSGKTFSTQQALSFLSDDDTPLGKIKYSLVILSAFGNAATECHSNSSRFGKLILLGYNVYSNKICDASLHSYLLEKTRVSSPVIKNFHIFYQVLAASIFNDEYDLHLKEDIHFRILPGKCTSSDMRSFADTLKAFSHLQFKHSTVDSILTILAAILHLGNVTFSLTENEKCSVGLSNEESLFSIQFASKLLGFEPETIKILLTHTIISPDSGCSKNTSGSSRRRSVYQIPVPTVADASARRDALIKTIYLLLFNWIISQINLTFSKRDSESSYKLGLLDIYGFEMFSRNGLEQLCINYANERLHSFFVQDFLLQKKMMLISEGLSSFSGAEAEDQFSKDTIARISVLDAPFSVFGVINEGSVIGRHVGGKDLCNRIASLPKNRFIITVSNEHKFLISHFAGAVKYDARHMVEKNSDKMPKEVINILSMSQNSLLASIISKENIPSVNKNTVLSKFKNSFDSLLCHLKASEVHYVRCIKPNIQMKPGFVDKIFLEKQLHSSGILEAVKLCGHCFPIRFTINEFLVRFYQLIGNYKLEQYEYCLETFQRTIISKWSKDMGLKCQVGNKNIFFNENELFSLEAKRQFLIEHYVRVIQRCWRLHWKNKRLKAAKIIKRFIAAYVSKKRSQKEVSKADENSVQILNKQDCTVAASGSISDKVVALSQGDTSKVDEDELMGCSVSQNVVCIKNDRGDNNFSVKINAGSKKFREGKMELMLSWLDTIPLTNSPGNMSQILSDSITNSNSQMVIHTSLADSGNLQVVHPSKPPCPKQELEVKPSLATSLVLFQEQSLVLRKNHISQSELFSVANKNYPGKSKLYSYHFLKKINVTEETKGKEIYFMGNGVVSRRALAKIPIWFHTRKTCLSYSYIVPFSELPKGLEDALT